MTAAGLGVALLPQSAAVGADVAVVEVTRPRLRRRTALGWNDAATSRAGQAFLEHLVRRFASDASADS